MMRYTDRFAGTGIQTGTHGEKLGRWHKNVVPLYAPYYRKGNSTTSNIHNCMKYSEFI